MVVRRTAVAATALPALALASTAARAADEPGQGAIVVWAEGPDKDLAEAKASAEVSANPYLVLIERRSYERELAGQGHRGVLAGDLKDARKRSRLLEQLRRSARNKQVDEVVIILTSREGRVASADLLVVDTAGSDAPKETQLPLSADGDSLSHAIREALPGAGAGARESVEAAESPAAVPSASRARSSDEQPTRDSVETARAARPPRHRVGDDAFEVSAAVGVGMRNFAYRDGVTENLRPYQLGAAPWASADGELYPFLLSGSSTKWATDVGVVLGYAQALALQSTFVEGPGKLNTAWSRYFMGGRVRFRTGSEANPVLGLVVGYGDEAFSLDVPRAPPLPDVNYKFIRASGDLRVPFGRVAAFASAGYLFILSAGEVAARFPKASVGGVEAELGGAFMIATGWEARLTGSYRRFFYAMHPAPGDRFVAGGALDELGSLEAGVAYVY